MLPGYGFPATEGGAPIAGEAPLQPTSATPAPGTTSDGTAPEANPLAGEADAIANGGTLYRARCFGCHMAAGGSGPRIFRSALNPKRYFEIVEKRCTWNLNARISWPADARANLANSRIHERSRSAALRTSLATFSILCGSIEGAEIAHTV